MNNAGRGRGVTKNLSNNSMMAKRVASATNMTKN